MVRLQWMLAAVLVAVLVPEAATALSPGEAAVAGVVDDAVGRTTSDRACKALAVAARHGDARITHLEGDVGNGSAPRRNTVFAIGSITKTLTAAVLVWSVYQGTVHLNDPLQVYAPPGIAVPAFGEQKILLSQLADHTSGLPRRVRNAGDRLQPDEAWTWLAHYRLPQAPGAAYQYSAAGYGFLGLALERANHATLQQLYDRVVSAPLGMRDTTFVLSAAQRTRLAQGYNRRGEPASQQPEWYPAFNAAGALYSTLDDMARYLDFVLHRVTTPASPLLAEMLKPRHRAKHDQSVGLGWDMETMGTVTVYTKHGSQPGYASMIAFEPSTQSGAVVLANQAHCPAPRIAMGIVRGLSGAGRGGRDRSDWKDED